MGSARSVTCSLLAAGEERTRPAGRDGRPFRLAILLAHPVQYFSPLFSKLAGRPGIELTVLYGSLCGAERMYDPGFRMSFSWDVALLDGYRYKQLRNWGRGWREGFLGCVNPGVVAELVTGNYDALLVFGWAAATNWLAFAAAAAARLPWVLYGDSNALDECDVRRAKRRLKRRVLGALFRRTGAFLTSGAFNRKFYELYGARPEKCFDGSWPIDEEWFEQRAGQARARGGEIRRGLGIQRETVLFLFVGKLIERKRPLDLLEALRRVRAEASEVAVAYAGEGELRERLGREIAALGGGAYLLGFRNQSELPEIYAAADALVLPSSREPRGTVVNEAMACGLPVIVSDRVGVWGPGDIVRNGENGFVYPCGEIGALAEAMRILATDPARRERMGRRSKAIIRNHGQKRFIEGLTAALDSLSGDRARAARQAARAGTR